MAKGRIWILMMFIAGALHAQPKLEVIGDSVHNFGNLIQGYDASYTLTLRNGGNSDLVIAQVNTGCHCTDARLTKKTIPPSDTASLLVTFHTERMNGPLKKAFLVESNDPDRGRLYLLYRVNILSVLDASPKYFYLGHLVLDQVNAASMTLRNSGEKKITIRSLSTPDKRITLTATKMVLAPGDTTRVTASITPTELATYKGAVTIELDSELQPKMTVYYGFTEARHR